MLPPRNIILPILISAGFVEGFVSFFFSADLAGGSFSSGSFLPSSLNIC